MTGPRLTIRNLTATPLELKVVERYEAPSSSRKGSLGYDPIGNLTALTSNLTTFVTSATTSSPTSPSAPQLADNAKSFSHKDVSIHLEPFDTKKTDIPAAERGPGEVLRLTFSCDGQRYRVDTPPPKHYSHPFTPLAQNPKHEYTGVFLKDAAHLSVYSSAALHRWMRELGDATDLAALSIPGTHNSPTCHRALPSVRCQAVAPKAQLEHGVRFFDVRVQPEAPGDLSKDGLALVHGVFPISLTGNRYLRGLVDDTLEFLRENRSETVVMSLKREGAGQHTDEQLSLILAKHYAHGDRWYTAPRIPSLGEARGKIVLMRRFALDDSLKREHGGAGWGINAENWAYNTPNDTHGDVCVQDFCEVLETENIDKKIRYSQEHLERAGKSVCRVPGVADHHHRDGEHEEHGKKQPLFLNFLSASNFWKVGCWPEKIAAKLNPAVVEFLCMKHHEGDGDGATGIVVCDWVGNDGDWDLVRCIVGMNARLELKEKQRHERH
ncbi:phosphatidylinositol phospholipase C [Lineolata rhizophorae]|uniref:Phosphatidylinositol phospholipase C n=1 Tax=Lineolata rhizophorae TaxID=578093 RepID=A0A6A6PA32_9PEZI|nr:phosphatidylinositol phospholipase C [Lineolata rhizophorae]